MSNHKVLTTTVSFFCLLGWVCAGEVIGAEDTAAANHAAQAAAPADQPAKSNIFDGADKAPEAAPTATPTPAADAAAFDAAADGHAVKVGAFGEIDLHVKDLEISTVLQLLSLQSKRNIVATKDVSGTVSADLFAVDFYEALDAILQPNGFGYREQGKFIYVYTQQQLAEIAKQEEKPEVRIIRLNYLNAKDASTFVTPLLSGAGSIALSGDVPATTQPTNSDNGANSSPHQDTLIVRDLQGNVEEIVGVIKKLDVKPMQVRIKATVLKASLTETNAFGVDVTLIGGATADDFVSPLSFLDEITGTGTGDNKGGVEFSPGSALDGPSNVRLGFVAGSVEAFIRALDEVTDTTVLANPEVLVLNRQRADLLVGRRLGYISTQQTLDSVTQTVEFLEVGTQLTVRPFVSDDGMVRLELRPRLSTGDTFIKGGFVVPDLDEQSLTTNVMVESGKTVVIGGLFEESTKVERSQVPGLGDIYLIGNAFKGVDDEAKRNEVIFLITPVIVKESMMYAQGQRAVESADLAMLGAREGLLIWSRTKQTSHQMQLALEAYRAGDNEAALYHANNALNLDSQIVDAYRIRANVTGQKMELYSRSILKDIVNHSVGEKVAITPAPAEQPQWNAAGANDNAKTGAAPAKAADDDAADDEWTPTPTDDEAGQDRPTIVPATDRPAGDDQPTTEDWPESDGENASEDRPADDGQPADTGADTEGAADNAAESDGQPADSKDDGTSDVLKAVNDFFKTKDQPSKDQPQSSDDSGPEGDNGSNNESEEGFDD